MGLKKILLTFLIFVALNTYSIIHTPGLVEAATMSLSPASGSYALGANFNVDIVVNPGTDTVSGAAAIVNFDKTKLTALSVQNGTMFSSPLNNPTIGTSADGTKGEVSYDSGSLGTGVTTQGVLATITFRTIAAGTAAVTFVFDPTLTTGTSMVVATSGPINLLTQTSGGSYTIAASGVTPTTPVMAYPPYATGAVENTLMAIGGGIFLLITSLILKFKF